MGKTPSEQLSEQALAQVFPARTRCLFCGKSDAAQGCNVVCWLYRRHTEASWMKVYDKIALPAPRCKDCREAHSRATNAVLAVWIIGFALIAVGIHLYFNANWFISGFSAFLPATVPPFFTGNAMCALQGVRPEDKESTYANYPPVAERLAEGGWALTQAGADGFPRPRQP